MNTSHDLQPPHALNAAEELLRDLRDYTPLAPYVLPNVWLKEDQASTISALASSAGVAVAVGLAEDVLPFAAEEKQGGTVRVGVCVYVFCPASVDAASLEPEKQSVWYTVLALCSRWEHTPSGSPRAIPARMESLEVGVDLKEVEYFAQNPIRANALVLTVPVRLDAR